MSPSRRSRSVLLVPAALLLGFAVVNARRTQAAAPEAELVLVPFVPTDVREPRTAEVALLVYNPVADEAPAVLERFEVTAGGDVLYAADLARALPGDPRYGEVNALVERLPQELTELHRERRYFAPADAPEFAGDAVFEARREIDARWQALAAEYLGGAPQPFVQLDFPLAYDQLFFADAPEGTQARLELRLAWRTPAGAPRTTVLPRTITKLAPFRPLAPGALAALGTSVTVHAGDLHVHSCHGEAAGACSPSSNCTAESLQTSGAFSYAQLKGQYQALGYDWYTATDHSYCVNSTSEFQAMQAECAAATDASFLVMSDMEVSSDESGPQIGSDLGDALCLWTTSANHMGAHEITTRIAAGGDGLLGFCDGLFSDVLDPFPQTIAAVRAQGGYPIINHPDGSSFGWNSRDATQGIEANAAHGVEIWNGATQSGQGGHVARWVDWLLGGRLLYAYSGSDTHDDAFAFGANHVLLADQPFTIANVHAALRAGRNYVSNAHSLVMEVGLGGAAVPMGAMHPVPAGAPAAALTPRVHYDFGADTGVITIFKGRVGDGAESVLCTSGPLTGAGTFACADALETGARSWYRAYSESGSKTAYTNPVFFLPVASDPASYCTGKVSSQGCTPTTTWQGTPSATSAQPFLVGCAQVVSHQNGILFYGYAPAFVPFQDGTRCVAPILVRTGVQNSGGAAGANCTGTFSLDFNARIQSGVDPGLVPGATVYAQHWFRDPAAASATGLSDAVQFTIGL
ncbi:MAG: CehA/McbA family metallohydrolase [Planctomycetes bacterium]|nr:CehA/McbA family metallohydrolase [Planctomycetota bacterium]